MILIFIKTVKIGLMFKQDSIDFIVQGVRDPHMIGKCKGVR